LHGPDGADSATHNLTALPYGPTRPIRSNDLSPANQSCAACKESARGKPLAPRYYRPYPICREALKSWGLDFEAFYIDGCKAYRQAIPLVFPKAAIQYDYFHIIQNIWRHLWRALVKHRKSIKRQAEGESDAEEAQRLTELAKRLWKRRGLIFKNEHRMSNEERAELRNLMAIEPHVGILRGFMDRVWGIFRDSKGEFGARQRLGKLRRRPEVQSDTAFAKVTEFLTDRFDDMTAFLRDPLVQRNSLAESGIRCLRRLEQGHDGFRGPSGRDAYLRLYQAIRYCGWSVHRGDGLLILPTPLPVGEVAA